MKVSREDVENRLKDLANYNGYWRTTLIQVLEDRLNQVDYKSLAEEMYEALKSASTYISQNNPHWSAPYHNETTRKIIEAISKWEKYGV